MVKVLCTNHKVGGVKVCHGHYNAEIQYSYTHAHTQHSKMHSIIQSFVYAVDYVRIRAM